VHDAAELLTTWNSFYVMIGSSAAALTGLMFVVMSLVSGRDSSEAGVSTFSTPTVVHFSCALFTAALMSAPFRSLEPIAIVLALVGVAGIVHVLRVARRTSRLENYQPDLEDWTWHALLPFFAYATIFVGALALQAVPARALYAPAAAVTLLIFIGIHNAWDVVTFIATGKMEALPDSPADTVSGSDYAAPATATYDAAAAREERMTPAGLDPNAPKMSSEE
jgi:hypothetical protein